MIENLSTFAERFENIEKESLLQIWQDEQAVTVQLDSQVFQ